MSYIHSVPEYNCASEQERFTEKAAIAAIHKLKRYYDEKHFVKDVNYCILNEEGRKIFIKAFEERMDSVFMHSKLKRKVSYRTALKLDCYKLIKNILEDCIITA